MGLDLSKFYSDNNFKFDKKMAYGIYRNRVISVVPIGNYLKTTVSFNQQLVKEQGERISFKLREIKNQFRVLQNAITTNLYLEITMYQSAEINEEFLIVLDKCLDVLDAEGLPTSEICPLCGQALVEPSTFIKVRDSVICIHDNCAEQFLLSSERFNKSFKDESHKKIKTTIAIALLSAAIVVALCILLAFASKMLFISGLASMIFFFIFKLLARKEKILLTKQNIIILGVVAIITAIVSIYLSTSMYLYSQLGDQISIGIIYKDFFKLIFDSKIALAKPMLFLLIINAFYIFIEVFTNYKRILHQESQIKKL